MKHREISILVEFKGEVSPENRRLLLRRVAWRNTFTLLGFFVPICLVALLIMATSFDKAFCVMMAAILGGICLLFAALIFALSFTKREQMELFPIHICFYDDPDHSVLFTCSARRLELYREDIRRVVDMGAYYYLDIPLQSGRGMICQKDLMTVGTEEIFEDLFEGKIERKQK